MDLRSVLDSAGDRLAVVNGVEVDVVDRASTVFATVGALQSIIVLEILHFGGDACG